MSGDVISTERDETPVERADRNWAEILQELRVLQTGAQILTGFLLAIAFQQRFTDITDEQRAYYLALVVVAGLTAITALSPVALHRFLFRQNRKTWTVGFGNGALFATLAGVAILAVGVVAFIFWVVVDLDAATVTGITLAGVALVLCVGIPVLLRALSKNQTATESPRKGNASEQ